MKFLKLSRPEFCKLLLKFSSVIILIDELFDKSQMARIKAPYLRCKLQDRDAINFIFIFIHHSW